MVMGASGGLMLGEMSADEEEQGPCLTSAANKPSQILNVLASSEGRIFDQDAASSASIDEASSVVDQRNDLADIPLPDCRPSLCLGRPGRSIWLSRAVMGLLSMSPPAIKTTALALNLLMAGIGAIQFWPMGPAVVAGLLSFRRSRLSSLADRRCGMDSAPAN